MRITTQMVNESARRAGLPINNTSLLSYINQDSSSTTENSLLSALSKNSKTDATQKSAYEQLEKSADALENAVSALTSKAEDNLFAQAREGGNTEVVKKQVKTFLSNYNDMLKKLGTSGSTLNSYYSQMLQAAYSENKDSLSSIGISADKNGYLSMDESRFDAADVDALEKALGQNSAFSAKISVIADRVASNASSNLESMSSQYSAAGQQFSTYLSSKYNFWG